MTDLFGEQFYPTPNATVHDMIRGLDLGGKRILDPSAGDGAILDVIGGTGTFRYGSHYKGELYAIEKDPQLRAILNDKGYKVIDSDFLQYNGHYYFDYILMNPPFANGANHLLKAWDIANGATIVCLLNAATVDGWDKPRLPINQGHGERDRLHHIIRQFGTVKSLGQPFKNSPRRPTPVEVVMVTLTDNREQESFRLGFDPQTVGKNGFHLPNMDENELAHGDIFDAYEARFNAAINAFKMMLSARQEVEFYLDGIRREYGQDQVEKAIAHKEPTLAYNEFLTMTTQSAWDKLFSKTKLQSMTTENVRREIEKLQAQQGRMAFTAANMQQLFYDLALNREHIMTECIVEAFDLITKYYDENREHVEGWKTNSWYFVPNKFILPYIGSTWGEGIDYQNAQSIRDIEKALCFLDGRKFETITSVTELYNHKSYYGERVRSTFFTTQLFKKRTMHFWWNNDDLRARFNIAVAEQRGWQLPEKIKKGMFK